MFKKYFASPFIMPKCINCTCSRIAASVCSINISKERYGIKSVSWTDSTERNSGSNKLKQNHSAPTSRWGDSADTLGTNWSVVESTQSADMPPELSGKYWWCRWKLQYLQTRALFHTGQNGSASSRQNINFVNLQVFLSSTRVIKHTVIKNITISIQQSWPEHGMSKCVKYDKN